MKLLFTGYVNTPEYQDPDSWLQRIEPYTGILKELAKSHDVVSIEHINYEGTVTRDGVTYQFINRGKNFHRVPFHFHGCIKQFKPDIVFINGFNFPLQTILLKLKLGKRAKIIILHRAERPFKGVKKWFQKIADHFVFAYLFSSAEFATDWSKNINTNKLQQVIQASSVFAASDKSLARQNLGISENEKMFLWIGNLDANKDPVTVAKAFAEYSITKANVKLYMIFQSDRLLTEIKKIISECGNGKQIDFIGTVEHSKLNAWLSASDFIISGSHYEGSGIAIAEAMSCGCIPIVTNITSFRGMTGPGKCGFLYEAGNPQALLKILGSLEDIDERKEKLRALTQFQSELSFAAIAKKINCITGYPSQCEPNHNIQGLAS